MLAWRAVIEPEFTFFQEQGKALPLDSIIFSQHTFRLVPKILDPVDVVLVFRKTLAVVDADMPELAHVQHVIAAQTVGVHQAIRLDFSLDHGQPGISLDVFNYQSVDLALTFEDAEDDDFAGSAASPFALSLASEITLVQFHRAVKDFVRLLREMPRDDLPDCSVSTF